MSDLKEMPDRDIPQVAQAKQAFAPSHYEGERPTKVKKSFPGLLEDYDQNRQFHVDQNYRLRQVIEKLRGVPERAIDESKGMDPQSLTDVFQHLNTQYRDNSEETAFLITLLEEVI